MLYKFIEHGREYYAYRGDIVYPFPVDEVSILCISYNTTNVAFQEENDRTDMFHCLIHDWALSGKLHNAELQQLRHRWQVLDVGCGTGIWCYDFASKHQSADVIGIDLMVNQPARPDFIPNCDFRCPVDFNEPNWPFQERSFDFIRASRLCGSVPDWQNLYHIIFKCVFEARSYL